MNNDLNKRIALLERIVEQLIAFEIARLMKQRKTDLSEVNHDNGVSYKIEILLDLYSQLGDTTYINQDIRDLIKRRQL